eukprot:TRINITY_DN6475_c0_g2_i1.p2 TRINITY_DN6475_c0_g2~~TRINITY_DN6475_c0_g2_i1.p2  ORF type:complete len:107 (+),score=15.43 TRINITY_DN6475_c0_g2_i1:46-366(+)
MASSASFPAIERPNKIWKERITMHIRTVTKSYIGYERNIPKAAATAKENPPIPDECVIIIPPVHFLPGNQKSDRRKLLIPTASSFQEKFGIYHHHRNQTAERQNRR